MKNTTTTATAPRLLRSRIFAAGLLLLPALILGADLTPRIAWQVETSDPRTKRLDLVYGETVNLQCTFKNYLTPLDIRGATVTLHAVTNNMPAGTSYQYAGTAGADGLATVNLVVDDWIPRSLTSVSYTLAVAQTNSARILRASGTAYLTSSYASSTNTPLPLSTYTTLSNLIDTNTAAISANAADIASLSNTVYGLTANIKATLETNGTYTISIIP